MTNETVIAILSELKKCYLGGIVDALDFAIEAVKAQEPSAVHVAADILDNKAIIKSITTISEALKTASDELNQLAGMLEERDKNTPTIADYNVDLAKCIAKSMRDNVKAVQSLYLAQHQESEQ